MNEKDIQFLTSLYQNTCTALQSIEELLPKIENEKMKKELSDEYSNYSILSKECEIIAKSENINLKDNNWFEKLRLWSSINITTLTDKSTRHLAELMLIGTVMGLIQCLKDAKDYQDCNKDLNQLCLKLQNFEEDNYQNLKNYI